MSFEWGHFWDIHPVLRPLAIEISVFLALAPILTKAAVERREARRPDHKGRKDASPASSRASPARKVPHRHLRFSVLHSPSLVRKSERKRGNELNDYGEVGAAKQPAGEAMCCLTIWLAQPDFLTEVG